MILQNKNLSQEVDILTTSYITTTLSHNMSYKEVKINSMTRLVVTPFASRDPGGCRDPQHGRVRGNGCEARRRDLWPGSQNRCRVSWTSYPACSSVPRKGSQQRLCRGRFLCPAPGITETRSYHLSELYNGHP